MGWRVTLVVEPGCGDDFESGLINIECQDLKEGQDLLNEITPMGQKIQEIITEKDENGESICWLKIPESHIKSLWLWFTSDDDDDDDDDDDNDDDDE